MLHSFSESTLGQARIGLNEIRTSPYRDCVVCGVRGIPLYQGLRDRLFSASGKWDLKKCPNPQCGLVWLDPMPAEEDIGKAYQNYFTHRDTAYSTNTWFLHLYRIVKEGYLSQKYGYHNESLSTWRKLLGVLAYLHPGHRAGTDFSVMYLPAHPDGRLLEVGCGSGQTLKGLQDLGWNVEGVDFDPNAAENAKRKGLKVHIGRLEAQKYKDNQFDAIIMSHIIEHVHNPLKLLLECHRILRPGGRLVVVTPNIGSLGHLHYKASWLHLDPPRHLHIFTLPSLCRLAEKAGFQKLKVSTTVRDADGVFMASRSIKRAGRHVWGGSQPQVIQIWARCMQLFEWLLLKLMSDIGEEILLIAGK